MSQLTSRGLDNTSYAFVSDIYIYVLKRRKTSDDSAGNIGGGSAVDYVIEILIFTL